MRYHSVDFRDLLKRGDLQLGDATSDQLDTCYKRYSVRLIVIVLRAHTISEKCAALGGDRILALPGTM